MLARTPRLQRTAQSGSGETSTCTASAGSVPAHLVHDLVDRLVDVGPRVRVQRPRPGEVEHVVDELLGPEDALPGAGHRVLELGIARSPP